MLSSNIMENIDTTLTIVNQERRIKVIQIITKYPIIDMLEDPQEYISEDFDEPILKIIHNDVLNPVCLLLGYDDKEKLYYFTLEDNETSEDFYCKDGILTTMFNEILEGKGDYEIWVKD